MYEKSESTVKKQVVLFDKTIRSNDLNKIKKYLDQGADIDSCDKNNKTILWWAAFHGNTELVSLLLERKANPNLSDDQGRTPLDIAREFRLKGYREFSQENPYAKIVLLLWPITETEVDSLANQMSRLGLHAKRTPTTPQRVVSTPIHQSAEAESWTCKIT
jgi:hypothetical protein